MPSQADLSELVFDNRFIHDLPGDLVTSDSIRQVEGACYSLGDTAHNRRPSQLISKADWDNHRLSIDLRYSL